jgi:hypothetical protein
MASASLWKDFWLSVHTISHVFVLTASLFFDAHLAFVSLMGRLLIASLCKKNNIREEQL